MTNIQRRLSANIRDLAEEAAVWHRVLTIDREKNSPFWRLSAMNAANASRGALRFRLRSLGYSTDEINSAVGPET